MSRKEALKLLGLGLVAGIAGLVGLPKTKKPGPPFPKLVDAEDYQILHEKVNVIRNNDYYQVVPTPYQWAVLTIDKSTTDAAFRYADRPDLYSVKWTSTAATTLAS